MNPEMNGARDMRVIPRVFWAWAAVVVLLVAKAQHVDVATLLADAAGPCSDSLLGR